MADDQNDDDEQKRVEQHALALVKAQLEDDPKTWLEIIREYGEGKGDILALIGALADHIAMQSGILHAFEEMFDELFPRGIDSDAREDIDRRMIEKWFKYVDNPADLAPHIQRTIYATALRERQEGDDER